MAVATWRRPGTTSVPAVTLTVLQKSRSVANNSSIATYKLVLHRYSGINSSTLKPYSVVINGVTVASGSINISGKNDLVVASGEVTIPHDANGKKTISFSFTQDIKITWNGGQYQGFLDVASGSGTLALTDIPRASTITTFNPFTIGSNIAWAVDRKYAANTHKVELLVANEVISSMNTTAASGTLSINLAAKNRMLALTPNVTQIQATLRVTTYTNSNYNVSVGSSQVKNVLATVGNEIQPDFTSISHSENVSSVQSLVGAYVKGKTRLNLAIVGAKAGEGSSISSYSITVAGNTVNSVSGVTKIINQSGSIAITAKVTDRRGRTVTASTNITVLDYSLPKIENVSFIRSNQNGEVDPLGLYVKVTFKTSVSSLKVNNVEKNKLKYRIKSKRTSESTYSTKADVNHGTLTYTGSTLLSGYLADFSFNFLVEVLDVFNDVAPVAGLVPNGILLMHWYRDSVAIGMMLPSEAFNAFIGSKGLKSNGPIIDKNDIEILGIGGTKEGNKLVNTEIKLGANTLLLESLDSLGIDYVIERGSNSNGSWEKWASGKLVQRGVFTATNGTTEAQGGIFRSASVQTQSYAMNFVSAPEVELKTQRFSAMDAMINTIAYDNFTFRLLHYVNQSEDTPVLYIAEGRWK